MAWVELLESHGGDMDSDDKGKVTRRFRVWGGVSVAQILTRPQDVSNDAGEFLPAKGSVHPHYIDGSMVLENYTCSTDSITVLATANYSNIDTDGSLGDPDKRIGTSFERRSIKLSFGSKKKLDIFKDQNPVIRWEVRESPVIHNFMRFTYRTKVKKRDPFKPGGFDNGWDGNASEHIRARIGEIHRFGFDGAPPASWQFSGADVSDRNAGDAVTITYEWVRDPGTVKYAITHPGKDPDAYFVWPPQDKPDGFGKKFVRPPFTSLVWVIDLETFLPIWFVQESEVIDDDGWKSLPGIP